MLTSYQCGGQIQERKLVLDEPAGFKTAMWRMKDGQRVTVSVEPERDRRSTAANRYLWGVVYRLIAEYTGQDPEDIHAEMCARFTAKTISYVNPSTGELVEMPVVTRTSGMTVREFYLFVEKVRLFASEFFTLTIPDPDPEYQHQRSAVMQEAA